MAPALSNPYPDSATGRPPKRPRKDSKSGHYDSDDNSHNSHNRSSPLDHIFISESLAPKKSGGKKVRFCSSGRPLPSSSITSRTATIVLLRMQKVRMSTFASLILLTATLQAQVEGQ